MKKLQQFILPLFLGISLNGHSQTMPPCGTNDAPGNSCLEATPICNLDGYCGTTDASYTVNTWGDAGDALFCSLFGFLCPTGLNGAFCGSIENNSFLSFVADATSISFDVWVYNSLYDDGIQIMIFQPNGNCSGDVTTYYCNGQMSPSPNAQTVTANGLTIGQTYYIMIDGYAGDVCDYTFAATMGVNTGVSVDLDPSTPICIGESVTATAQGGNGTYTWNASPDLSATTGSVVTITPPTAAGSYSYTVNSTGGTTFCPENNHHTFIVEVEACPCSISASASQIEFCEGTGNTVDLSATPLPDASYSWSHESTIIGSTQNLTGIALPTTPGIYNYLLTATESTGTTCTSNIAITVNSNPIANAGPDQTITCLTSSVALNGTNSTSGVNYSWSGPGLTSSNTVASPTANAPGTYILQVTNPTTGCVSANDTVVVLLNTIPPSASITGNLVITPCISNSTTLTAATTTAGVTYNWTGVGITGATNASTATVNQAGQYEVTITNPANGCTASATVNVTTFNPPAPTIFADTIMCATSFSIPLDSIFSYGGGYWREQNNLGTFSPSMGVPNPTFTPASGTTNYTLVFTDSICGISVSANVQIRPFPIVNPVPPYSCGYMSEILTTSSHGGGIWTVIDNPSTPFLEDTTLTFTYGNPTSGGNAPTHTLATSNPTPGTYNLNFYDYACETNTPITLNFIDYPWTEIKDSAICFGASMELHAWNNMEGLTFLWDDGSTGSSLHVTQPGTYTVIVSNVCYDYLDSAVITNKVCDIDAPNVISLSSKEGNNLWFVNSDGVKDYKCLIVNRWGNVVAEMDSVTTPWTGRDRSGNIVSEGVYFYTIEATYESGDEITKQGFIQVVH